MKLILTINLFLYAVMSLGQDTTYYNKNMDKLDFISQADYYEVIYRDVSDTNKVTEKLYFISRKLKSEKPFSNYKDRQLDGKLKRYYKDGQLKTEIDYRKGKKSGDLLTFYENGKPKRIDKFDDGKLIKGGCFGVDGKDTTYYDYEIMPTFPGGDDKLFGYLSRTIRYPKESREKGIQGRVYVSFYVNEDGSISDVKLVRGVSSDLDEESMRVIRDMPTWTPGMEDGEKVRVKYNLPISFTLK